MIETGAWKVQYRSRKEVCDTKNLAEVLCLAGYEEKGNQCIPVPIETKAELQVIMAVSISTVLALCVMLLIFLVRKNPKKFRKIFVNFMRTEVKMALTLFAGKSE